MKFTVLCLVVLATIVGLEAVHMKAEDRAALSNDEKNLDEGYTSECNYVYYLWDKKFTIYCESFCSNYNKIATCVNGACKCLKKPDQED